MVIYGYHHVSRQVLYQAALMRRRMPKHIYYTNNERSHSTVQNFTSNGSEENGSANETVLN